MSGAETILAAIATADLCLKYGNKFYEVCKAYKRANDNLQENLLTVEAIWSRTSIQLEFLKRVARTLEPEHCRINTEIIETLSNKLMVTTKKIDSLMKKGKAESTSITELPIKKWKYILVRETLDEMISDLKNWQQIFDPTWFLILRMGDKLIDTELFNSSSMSTLVDTSEGSVSAGKTTLETAQKLRGTLKSDTSSHTHITLPSQGMNWESASPVEYSTTRIMERTGSNKKFAVSSIVCNPSIDVRRVRADAEDLAKKLKQIDPNHDTFGLLSCHGVVKRKNPETGQLSSIEVVFRLPPDKGPPSSLRQQLLQPSKYSLTYILNTAQQLAEAVSFVHTCQFVHKNITPETILVFPDEESALGSAYLVGFDSFRNVNFHTLRAGDEAWERNLYRHPFRQGLHAQENFVMQHDVYSLGVCLLELGLWENFVEYESSGDDAASPESMPSKSLGLQSQDFDFSAAQLTKSSARIKDRLVELARSKLPQRMGNRYTEVVLTCLTCLDEGNEGFGDDEDMRDEDGILIGVRFIEKVVFRLSKISF